MPPEESAVSSHPKGNYSNLYTPIAIVIAGALVGGGLYLGMAGKGGSPSGQTAGAAQAVDVKNVKTADEPYIGSANAPLTMAYWSDYQCPFCKAVEVGGVQGINIDPSIPTIIKKYVDTGKLKIIFKDFAFLGKDSIAGAEYARAVWALYPDQFYAWRAAMYKAQDAEGDVGFGNASTIDTLIKAQFPKIDDAKIKANIATKKKKYDDAIAVDQQEGASFGIQGTPGFIIGTQMIDGAQQLSAFESAIDSQ
jgi:protein-disulfide isomerase